MPKVAIRGRSVAGAGSLTPFPSTGAVYRAPGLGRELTVVDIQGAVVFGDLGGGLVAGASGTAMLFGMNSVLLLAAIASTSNPSLMARALAGATGAVVFAGVNVGAGGRWDRRNGRLYAMTGTGLVTLAWPAIPRAT